jgi:hypothetical protein
MNRFEDMVVAGLECAGMAADKARTIYREAVGEFRCIEPESPEAQFCEWCRAGKHTLCAQLSAASAADRLCDCTHGADEYCAAGGGR